MQEHTGSRQPSIAKFRHQAVDTWSKRGYYPLLIRILAALPFAEDILADEFYSRFY